MGATKLKLMKEFLSDKEREISFKEFLANHSKRFKRYGGNPGTLTREAITQWGPLGSSYFILDKSLYYFTS